jgi:hypothetical protein
MPAFDAKTATPLAGSKVATDDVFIIGDVSADGFAVVRADNIATAIGVTAANPTATVGLSAVNGSASTFLRSDGAPALSQAIAPTWTGPHIYSPAARASGVAPYFTINAAADTGATASTEHIGISVTGATRQHAAGAITTQREIVIGAPTYSFASASTITNAATVAIAAPVAGTNATITNPYALSLTSSVGGGRMLFLGNTLDNRGDMKISSPTDGGVGAFGEILVGVASSGRFQLQGNGGTFTFGISSSTANSTNVGNRSGLEISVAAPDSGTQLARITTVRRNLAGFAPAQIEIFPGNNSGTNQVGAQTIIGAGNGTGNGTPGDITFQAATALGSGSTVQSRADVAKFGTVSGNQFFQPVVLTSTGSGPGSISSPANSPAQITANQDNYSPGVGMFQRWSSDASRNVTGMVAGQAGEMRYIWNVGANDIVLQNENASSTAANRFTNSTGADITVGANKCALCMYDATSSRWRVTLLP